MQVQMMAAAAKSSSLNPVILAGVSPGATTTVSFSQLPGPLTLIRSVIHLDGFRGLWHGHTGTLLRETGGSAAWFSAKETASRAFLSRRARLENRPYDQLRTADLRPWESMLAGACGGVSYTVALFPADSVKSAMQTEEEMRPRKPLSATGGVRQSRATFSGTFRAIYARQGVRGLYAGCGITMLRSAPGSGVIFLVYDTLVKRFG